MGFISVIIPVYQDSEGLQQTLNALMRQSLEPSRFEVIVINDGGDPEIVGLETRYNHKQLLFIHRFPNRGSYYSRNEGISKARYANLAFTDAGCVPDKMWLENGLKHLDRHDYVAGAVGIDPQLVDSISTYHDYLTAFPIKDYFHKHSFGVTANLFVKKNVFQKVGLFNEKLFSGGDMEFGVRVSRQDELSSVFAEDCLVMHAPRNHQMKVHKIKRVKEGQEVLKQQNPEHFAFLKRSWSERLKAFLPPSYNSFKTTYKPDKRFSKLAFYAYMYRLKIIKGLI